MRTTSFYPEASIPPIYAFFARIPRLAILESQNYSLPSLNEWFPSLRKAAYELSFLDSVLSRSFLFQLLLLWLSFDPLSLLFLPPLPKSVQFSSTPGLKSFSTTPYRSLDSPNIVIAAASSFLLLSPSCNRSESPLYLVSRAKSILSSWNCNCPFLLNCRNHIQVLTLLI